MAQIRCPVNFCVDNGCFLNEKYLKLLPKITKNQKYYIFRNLNAIFVYFLTNFVDSNVDKRQRGKNFSPVGLFEELIAVF